MDIIGYIVPIIYTFIYITAKTNKTPTENLKKSRKHKNTEPYMIFFKYFFKVFNSCIVLYKL